VLIDYVQSDIAILALVSEMRQIHVPAPGLDEVDGLDEGNCGELGLTVAPLALTAEIWTRILACTDMVTYRHRCHPNAANRQPMNPPTVTQQLKDFVKERGLVRRKDVEDAGYPTALLYRLRDRGELLQLGPGLFKHPDSETTEKHTYAEAAKLVPHGVVCLVSALAFHEIGTQMPRRVWMALERDRVRKKPRQHEVPMEFVWFSGAAFEEGQPGPAAHAVVVLVVDVVAHPVEDRHRVVAQRLGQFVDLRVDRAGDGLREQRGRAVGWRGGGPPGGRGIG